MIHFAVVIWKEMKRNPRPKNGKSEIDLKLL
jgi:hypothetical protein